MVARPTFDLNTPRNPDDDPLLSLDEQELEVLAKVSPQYKVRLERLRQLQTKLLQVEAVSRGGFAQKSPVDFTRYVLGLEPTPAAKKHGYTLGITPQQVEVFNAIQHNVRTAVPSGHATGKTFGAAVLVPWFLLGKKGSVVVTTAPNFQVVEEQIWRTIADLFHQSRIPLPGRLLNTEWLMGGKWYAIGISTDRPGSFRGRHGSRTMIIFDEAVDVREDLYEEAESMILSDEDRFVLFFNPTDPTTKAKRCCDDPAWKVVRLDARDHPNVVHDDPMIVPGAVTRKRIEEYSEMYGGDDSPGFLARVAGIFPASSETSLIPYQVVVRAQDFHNRREARLSRDPDHRVEERIRGGALGLDVAGEGSDLMVLWEIYDGIAKVLWWSVHTDLMESVGKVLRTIREGRGRYQALAIDDTGIGNGVSSRLLEVQRFSDPNVPGSRPIARTSYQLEGRIEDDSLARCAIIRVNFASRPTDFKQAITKFWRIKDQMWWNTRLSLQQDKLGLPSDAEFVRYKFPKNNSMVAQLTAPFFTSDSSGNIHVFDKYSDHNDRTKALPRKSPDIAHGLILANHAYRMLRPEFAANPPKTMLELRQRQMADLISEYKRGAITKDAQSSSINIDEENPEDNYSPDFYRFLQ